MSAEIGRTFRNAMRKRCLAMPGAFNGLVARMVRQKGFEAAYISGGALSAASGVPDVGLLSMDRFVGSIKEVVQSSGLPVLCDADTGFGEAEMVTRTVYEYIHAGAAGCHIEDQVFPKRCGHLDGKALIPAEQMVEKIRRARAASDAHSDGEFVICARTDAFGVTGMKDALARARLYVEEGGADMVFPEGLGTRKQFQDFAQAILEVRTPLGEAPFLLANMTEFGKSDYLSVAEFENMGYHCVIFPVTTLRCAMKGVEEVLDVIKEEGVLEGHLDRMQSRDNLYTSLGYIPGKEWSFPNTPTVTDTTKP